jgi:hypothetical protein
MPAFDSIPGRSGFKPNLFQRGPVNWKCCATQLIGGELLKGSEAFLDFMESPAKGV